MLTILLLTISNIFMTFAWYGHLKYRNEALWKVTRQWGHRLLRALLSGARQPHRFVRIHGRAAQNHPGGHYSHTVFSVLYLGDKFKWNYAIGFAFVAIGSFFIFHKW
jgi:uncharacterized protein (DUF486 family)